MQLVVKDVCRLFDVPEKTVYRWISRREIPAWRVNGEYRFSRDELIEWATERKLDVSKLLAARPGGDEALPSIADALRRGGVHHGVSGTHPRAVLEALVQRLKLPEGTDRAHLLELLLAREAVGTTGVGEGIAVPHVRSPVVLDVDGPSIALGLLETPVEFGAVDGRPVEAVFLLVTPSARVHLHVLSRLARLLKDSTFREAVRRGLPAEDVFAAADAAQAAWEDGA